jgi:hypothetical protein
MAQVLSCQLQFVYDKYYQINYLYHNHMCAVLIEATK